MTVDHELPIGRCAECGATFRKARADQRFCPTSLCRQKWYRRHEVRGGQVYRMVYTLRAQRGRPPDRRDVSLTDVTRLIDEFIAADKAIGRAAP